MNRLLLWTATALIALGATFSARAQSDAPAQLRIGFQKSAVNLVLLKQQGVLEKRFATTKLQWIEFPAGPQLLEALAVGSLDLGLTGDSPPVFAQAAGKDLRYVGAEPPKPRSSAILVKDGSPIRTLADLKGKRVAFQRGSSAHYLVVAALAKAKLAWSDITPIYLPPSDARAAFERDNVDAWAIWDPFYAATEVDVKPRVLHTGEGLSSNNSFYLASSAFTQQHPQTLLALLDELTRSDAWLHANRKEAARILSDFSGLNLATVHRFIERRPQAPTGPLPAALVAEQQRVADAFLALGLIPKPVKVAEIVWQPAVDPKLAKAVSPMKILWFIPTHGDSRFLGSATGARAATFDYFRQIAIAADSLGYEGVLIPTGRSCEDPWMVATSLIEVTRRLKFLVALRPGLVTPSLAARMAASFDRLSGGRLLINLVTGGDAAELAGDGQFLDHAARYEQSAEFMTIWREVMARGHEGKGFDFDGKHLQVKDAKLLYPGVQRPYPPLYFGGSSEAAHELAAEQFDSYLTWGEPPAAVAEKVADIKRRAAKHGRSLSFGIRLHVIVRETEDEAWRAASELLSHLDESTVAAAQARFSQMDSVGQRRMAELNKGKFNRANVRDGLEIAPNLWAGVGLVRGGAGTALVGSAEQVAERIEEYAALGLDTFILSGYPHLEEAHRVAELLFPLLPVERRITDNARPVLSGPFGEIVANGIVPPGQRPALKEAAS